MEMCSLSNEENEIGYPNVYLLDVSTKASLGCHAYCKAIWYTVTSQPSPIRRHYLAKRSLRFNKHIHVKTESYKIQQQMFVIFGPIEHPSSLGQCYNNMNMLLEGLRN